MLRGEEDGRYKETRNTLTRIPASIFAATFSALSVAIGVCGHRALAPIPGTYVNPRLGLCYLSLEIRKNGGGVFNYGER